MESDGIDLALVGRLSLIQTGKQTTITMKTKAVGQVVERLHRIMSEEGCRFARILDKREKGIKC